MKRAAILLLILALLILLFLFWRRQPPQSGGVATTPAGDCMQNAEAKVAEWKKANMSDREIERLFQVEAARCSGVAGACAAFIAAVNVDYAWLGRQVLSGSMTPEQYLARVRDRSLKLKVIRQHPETCDAYGRGDADGDLVPDETDKCPATANLVPTGPDGCDSTAPLPTAPTAQAVTDAAKALKVPLSPACRNAPVPGGSAVLRAGLNPADENSFLIEVTAITGQPDGCPMFYEVEARLTSSSFFSGAASQDIIRRVYRAADAVTIPDPKNQTLVFQLRQTDGIPWNALTRTAIEPSDHARKHLRVRAVNGNGSSAGWSSVRVREFRPNSRGFQ